MKRRIRILTTVMAMLMVVVVMTMGIWAATNVAINGSNTITFEMNDVLATVTMKESYGIVQDQNITISDSVDGKFDATTAHNQELTATAGLTQNITFSAPTDTYTLEITVKNDFVSAEQAITAELSVTALGSGLKATANNADITVDGGSCEIEIEKNTSGTITVVVSLTDLAKETGVDTANGGFAFTLSISKKSA